MTGDRLFALIDLVLAVALLVALVLILFAPATAHRVARFIKKVFFGGDE